MITLSLEMTLIDGSISSDQNFLFRAYKSNILFMKVQCATCNPLVDIIIHINPKRQFNLT